MNVLNFHFNKGNNETQCLSEYDTIIKNKLDGNYGLTYFHYSISLICYLEKNKCKYSYYVINDKNIIILFEKAQKEKKLTSFISEEQVQEEQKYVLNIAYKDASLIPYIIDVKEKIAHHFGIKNIDIAQVWY